MPIRVRFAPSPTGDLHIGGVRTALYNFLYARHEKGTFVLRIEDTDQKRNRDESLASIKDGLAWCGLTWDEGPHYQSLRLDRYRAAAAELEKTGRAYWQEDPEKGKALYFRIDREVINWKDLIHGPMGRDVSGDKDLVCVKSDGFPTYNFAVVVDDHDMAITHVLRGDDHIPNTPIQISLYRAFGWTPPEFGHLPMILAPDGSKLSKRETEKYRAMGLPVTVGDCRALGYLPETIVNYMALLGWSPGGDLEMMTLDDMVRLFTLDRVGNTQARFDVKKLLAMNGDHIRRCSIDRLAGLTRPYIESAYGPQPIETIRLVVQALHVRLDRLDKVAPAAKFAFTKIAYDPAAVTKVLKAEGAVAIVRELRAALADLPSFDQASIDALLKRVAENHQTKLANVAQPLRVAVTGGTVSPPIHDTLAILGRERVLARIDEAINLGPPVEVPRETWQFNTERLAREIRSARAASATEEDLKMRVEPVLQRAFESLGVAVDLVKYERGTGLRGRIDALYGFLVLEYESPGKLGTKGGLRESLDQIKRYMDAEAERAGTGDESKEKFVGVALDGDSIAFVRFSRSPGRLAVPLSLGPAQRLQFPDVPGFQVFGPFPINGASLRALLAYARAAGVGR